VARTSARIAVVLVLVGATGAGAPARAVSGAGGDVTPNPFGKGHRLLPTTAALLIASEGGSVDADNAELGCSATLIGCSTVLTAGHCVEDMDPEEVQVYLRHGGIVPVESIAIHPNYTSEYADIAVLQLAAPVTGIAPSRINDVVAGSRLVGSRGVIAGFGISTDRILDSGIQRSGVVVTGSCADLSEGEMSDRNFICWQYDGPYGAAGHDANTCSGDSGGPLFVNVDGQTLLAGVTSGGSGDRCGEEEMSYDANVFTWRRFILDELAGDSLAACGALAPVGSAATSVADRGDRLEEGTEVRYVFTVGPGAEELRVTLNGQDEGDFDPDLYVAAGTDMAGGLVCSDEGASAFASCVVEAPEAGEWTVVVRGASGSGIFQLTGTVFGARLEANRGLVLASDEGYGSDVPRRAGARESGEVELAGLGVGDAEPRRGGIPATYGGGEQRAFGGLRRGEEASQQVWSREASPCGGSTGCQVGVGTLGKGDFGKVVFGGAIAGSCEAAVCDEESSCCEQEWDGDCDDLAAELCEG
jgi:hypothetical protein